MRKVLLDTDVILDCFLDRQPFSEYSAQILSLCERKIIEGYVTAVIFSNTYYVLRQLASHEKVIQKLSQLLEITEVLIIDKNMIYKALKSGFTDFEDALQNFSALNNGTIEAIITRNIKDYRKSELAVFTPENFLNSIHS